MLKRRNKHFALLLVLAMLATMFVGIGTAAAASVGVTTVGNLPSISSTGVYTGASLVIDEGVKGNFATGDVIVLTLPSGVKYNSIPLVTASVSPGYNGSGTTFIPATQFVVTPAVGYPGPTTVNITVTGAIVSNCPTAIAITMPLDVTSVGSGAINVTLVAPGSAVNTAAGNYTIASFISGGATVTALSTPVNGGGNQSFGTVRIIENTIGALSGTITLKLPGGFTWTTAPTLTESNNTVFTSLTSTLDSTSQIATFTITAAGTGHPGIFDITTPITVASSAGKGDVVVTVGGTANVSNDVTVGSYADYGVTVTADAAKGVVSAIDAQKIANVQVKEGIAASLFPGRTITFTLPTGIEFSGTTGPTLTLVTGGGTGWTGPYTTVLSSSNTVATFTLPSTVSTSAAEFDLKNVYIDAAANASGDVHMVVGGNGGASGDVVVATCTPIVTMSATPKDVIIGLQAQPGGDITIVEGQKGALLGGKAITLIGPDGVTFSTVPTVAVTAGNLTIKSVSKSGGVVTINTDASSTVASTILVSNIMLTADRTVPEGPAKVVIAGSAVMQNTSATSAANFISVTYATGVADANVVTPAPGGASNVSTFVVGANTFTLNKKTVNCYSLPYIKNNRTFLSIRDIGAALGIDQANILWDASKSTVTLMRGDKVVQVMLGSNVMLINGAAVTMDVAPEYNPAGDRAMLPAAWIANAFGGSAVYDDTTQSVTINS